LDGDPDVTVLYMELRSETAASTTLSVSAYLEPGHVARNVVTDLAAELRSMQEWLDLGRVEVGTRGDLAAPLRRSVSRPR
jgi:uncharacterized protein YcaQ